MLHSAKQELFCLIMTTRFTALLSVGLLCSLQASYPQTSARPSVERPTLHLSSTDAPNIFRAEVHNPGTKDLLLKLGIELANGARQWPDNVTYTLTTPDGRDIHLVPLHAFQMFGGRIDPLIVPLPSGATFSFPINLDEYCDPKAENPKLHLRSGRYTLNAELKSQPISPLEANLDMKGVALMPVWVGTVAAAPIVFTVPVD